MSTVKSIFAAAFVATVAYAPASFAQERYYVVRNGSPLDAFELTVSGAGTEGFGRAGQHRITDIGDIANGGFDLGIGLGYRVDPFWSLDLNGSYQWYSPGPQVDLGAGTQGMSADFGPTLHFRPFSTVDPWLHLAAGYRALYEVSGPGHHDPLVHGPKLGRFAFGLDLRPAPRIAISPFVGVDFDAFVYDREDPLFDDHRAVEVNTFVTAGVLGRFDFGGHVVVPRRYARAY